MAAPNTPREIEIKLALRGASEGRRVLSAAGFRVSRRRVFEANTLFDTSRQTLRRAGRLLRVREAGRLGTITYKGPPVIGKYKDREELEVETSDAARFAEILTRLDFRPVFRYEKYRTEYRRGDETGLATLDETPVGVFLELEGAPGWIDRNARRLGFREAGYITASYYALYAEHCRKHGVRPTHMTFTGAAPEDVSFRRRP
jgi:adenylate cyclase class 2